MDEPIAESISAVQSIRPFGLIVDPSQIQAAAERIAKLDLPRVIVKAFSSDKERPVVNSRASRRTAEAW